MDHRVIGERSDAVLRTAMPGGDEGREALAHKGEARNPTMCGDVPMVERAAVPASGIRNPAPGWLRDTTRPAKGLVGEEFAGLDKPEAGKTPAPAPSQETWFWS